MAVTLLDVVNSYMDATDGIPVDSIEGGTLEAQQVANIAKEVYDEVVNDIPDWRFTTKAIRLEAVSDSNRPNYLRIPDNVARIQESVVMYDTSTDTQKKEYTTLKYLPPIEFMRKANSLDGTQSNVALIVDFGGIDYYIQNDKQPEYWTSFDDVYIVADSYDSSVDSTLQASKTQVFAQVQEELVVASDTIIPLPDHFIPVYKNLVKARASEYLREEPLFSDATKGRAGLIKARHDHYRVSSRDGGRSNKQRYGRRK